MRGWQSSKYLGQCKLTKTLTFVCRFVIIVARAYRVQGSRVSGLGFSAQDSGSRVSGFGVARVWFGMSSTGCKIKGVRCGDRGLGFRKKSLGGTPRFGGEEGMG